MRHIPFLLLLAACGAESGELDRADVATNAQVDALQDQIDDLLTRVEAMEDAPIVGGTGGGIVGQAYALQWVDATGLVVPITQDGWHQDENGFLWEFIVGSNGADLVSRGAREVCDYGYFNAPGCTGTPMVPFERLVGEAFTCLTANGEGDLFAFRKQAEVVNISGSKWSANGACEAWSGKAVRQDSLRLVGDVRPPDLFPVLPLRLERVATVDDI